MMVSKTTGYALRLLIYLARRLKEDRNSKFFVHEIAKEIGAPPNFLSKIVVLLSKKGILTSQKGPKGGIMFKVPPHKITIYDVCEMFDEEILKDICLLGLETCDDDQDCPMHKFWKDERDKIIKFFKSTSIAKLAKD